MIAPGINDGDKVRVELLADLFYSDGDYGELAVDDDPPQMVPLDLSAKGVSVVPADAPTPLDVALGVLADRAAGLENSAKWSDLPEFDQPESAERERREADAVRRALVAVLAATAVPAGDGHGLSPEDAALALVDAASRKLAGGAL
jgi:hypothetical protein